VGNDGAGIFTRRKFIALTSFTLFSSLIPATSLFSFDNESNIVLTASRDLINDKLKFFTQHQARVIEEVTSLIIPTDSSPGAREAGIVFELDRLVSNNKKLQLVYSVGVEWLDHMAGKLFGKKNFIDLQSGEMVKILSIADPGSQSDLKKEHFSKQYGSMHIVFFNHVKDYTIYNFYSSELGWEVSGYQGPPQWSGNLDYFKCSF